MPKLLLTFFAILLVNPTHSVLAGAPSEKMDLSKYSSLPISQKQALFLMELEQALHQKFSPKALNRLKEYYEHVLFSHIALMEGRSFINYTDIHADIETHLSQFPKEAQETFRKYKARFTRQIKHLLENKHVYQGKDSEYLLNDDLNIYYALFIKSFLCYERDFFKQALISSLKSNIPLTLFNIAYLDLSQYNKNGFWPERIRMPSASVLDTTNLNDKIILLDEGCCGNTDVECYYLDSHENKIIPAPIDASTNSINLSASISLDDWKDPFFYWDKDNLILTVRPFQSESQNLYQFNLKQQKWSKLK